MGSLLGITKVAAKRAGVCLREYQRRISAGLKRCTGCTSWLGVDEFGFDSSRGDGRDAKCFYCRAGIHHAKYIPVPIDQRRPMGTPRLDPRHGDKIQARHLINLDVKLGNRPNPNALHCANCGHKGPDKRHEYHHHMGYAARHHYDVLPLCSTCHHEAHRGENIY